MAPGRQFHRMPETFLHLDHFPVQLLLIGQILPLAAAADPKVRAERRRIRRRLLQDLHHLGFGELRFFPGEAHPQPLPGKSVLHEDHKTAHPSQGFAAKGQLFYGELYLRPFGQRGGRGPGRSPRAYYETCKEQSTMAKSCGFCQTRRLHHSEFR